MTERERHGAGGVQRLQFLRDGVAPVTYSPRYTPNFAALGIKHPSQVRAPTRIHAAFIAAMRAAGVSDFATLEPEPLRDDEIALVHAPGVIDDLASADAIARVLSIPAFRAMSVAALQQHIVSAQRSCGGGTRLGVRLALERGWAINLKGGLHHAKHEKGEGFCFFSDVAIAHGLINRSQRLRDTLIIDLDAHQGNGAALMLGDRADVRLMDVFNRDIYPRDETAARRVKYCYPLSAGTGDDEYLRCVTHGLLRAFAAGRPDLVIYIAGTDIVAGDPLGKLAVSVGGLYERDRLVWGACVTNGVPILMCLAGGYSPRAGEIAGQAAAACVLRHTDAHDDRK
ncbi:MAG: histone deacetylase [Phycisphaerales bacterium]|nr:histone deacetylase [Phycisphaerales bacterium]